MSRFRWGLVSFLVLSGLSSSAWGDSYEEEEQAPELEPPVEEEKPAEDLRAGGLSAPEGLGRDSDRRTSVEKELDEADARDSGRGLEFFWLGLDVGFWSVGASTFAADGLLATSESSGGTGLLLGGGLGIRVLYFTLGARARYADVGAFQVLAVTGEVGFKLPLGNLEPFVNLDVGGVGLIGVLRQGGFAGLSGVGGLDARLTVGGDYYFSDYFSLGAQFGVDLLVLSRPAYAASELPLGADPVYGSSGSSLGGGLAGFLTVGFHL